MKTTHFAAALALACLAGASLATPALAQAASDTQVSAPIGSWLDELIGAVFAAITTAALYALRKLPAQLLAIVMTLRGDQLLEKALAYGREAAGERVRDMVWSVDAKNAAIAAAARYALDHAPGLVEQWLGGSKLVEEKLRARLQEWIDAAAPNAG